MKKCLVLLLSAAALSHAATVVLPNASAAAAGGTTQFGIFGNGSSGTTTFEWEIAASQLTAVTGSSVTAIGFRLPANNTTVSTSTFVGPFSLQLSSAANPIGSLSTNLASNIGPGAVTVINNPALTIPANSFIGGSTVNPFFFLSFTTPYLYTGGNLLFTVNQSSTASLGVDARTPDAFGDSAASFNSGPVQTEFYNYPVTALQFSASTVPEPSTLLLLAGGALAFAWRRRSL